MGHSFRQYWYLPFEGLDITIILFRQVGRVYYKHSTRLMEQFIKRSECSLWYGT